LNNFEVLVRMLVDRIVVKYEINKRVRPFACWNQILFKAFGQLAARDNTMVKILSRQLLLPDCFRLLYIENQAFIKEKYTELQ
jgi:hypothetical protein